MDITVIGPTGFNWPHPWESISADDARRFEFELRAELPAGHVLETVETVPIARWRPTDDVVFATTDEQHPVAIVHLTWKGSVEFDPLFPWTRLYRSLSDALENWPPP